MDSSARAAPVDSEIVNKNWIIIDSEIINETTYTADAWIP
jgi:hypothetical protein